MDQNNFFIQLFKRLFSSNPKFFKIIQVLSLTCAAITGLPWLLNYFGINLPPLWVHYESLAVAKAALLAALIAQLPKQDPIPAPTGNNSGSGTAAKMILFLFCYGFSMSASAQKQPVFGKLHAPVTTLDLSPFQSRAKAFQFSSTNSPDSTFAGWRAQGPSIVYAYGGSSSVMAGIGIGYEHDTWRGSSWYKDYSVGPMIYGGGMVAPSSLNGVVAFGAQATLFNGYVTFGGGYDAISKKFIALVGLNFDFYNN